MLLATCGTFRLLATQKCCGDQECVQACGDQACFACDIKKLFGDPECALRLVVTLSRQMICCHITDGHCVWRRLLN